MTLTKPAILLVDGYNVIGASPRLSQLRDQIGLEEARHRLTELLVNYSAYQGFATELIFDAYSQAQERAKQALTDHLSIAYTAHGQTADTYIERYCARFFRKDVRRFRMRLIVATSDRAQWLTAFGYGAEWMSSQKLLDAMNQTATQALHHSPKQPKPTRKQMGLAKSLDTQMQQKLARLRQELLNQGS
ncbi:MAG: NYN domain-containing protein [Cyanobacteria bacterium P01_H01_bin.121]